MAISGKFACTGTLIGQKLQQAANSNVLYSLQLEGAAPLCFAGWQVAKNIDIRMLVEDWNRDFKLAFP